MKSPLEIVSLTPKSNCGRCGHPTCLAFAVNVVKGLEEPQKCPFIKVEDLGFEPIKKKASESEYDEEHDLAFIKHLKSKISPIDFIEVAPQIGATLSSDNRVLLFNYLGRKISLSKADITADSADLVDPRDQILLYNYVYFSGGSLSNEWIGMESMPNSISKVRTLETYCENKLAELFSGKSLDMINSLTDKLGGTPGPDELSQSASAGIIIPVLPRVPQFILFWDEEPEDGFSAKVKILYDKNALEFLDIESLLFSSERLAERLEELAG
jgi:hypothetical protein